MKEKEGMPEIGMAKGRMEALNDGVFAIAMTLLILNIELPTGEQSLPAIRDFFIHSLSQFFDYGLSFILLAFFWTAQHRQFHWIMRLDDRLLWLNMLLLLFIAVVPLSTALYGDYRSLWPPALFINLNLFIVLLILYGMWAYASSHRELLSPDLPEEHLAFTKRPSLSLVPLLSITAIILSFITPVWSTTPYIFVPFIMTRKLS